MTNCNHKHGLMSACRHDVDIFTCGRIVLHLPKCAHVDWNWSISRTDYLKRGFLYSGAHFWNDLSLDLRQASSLADIKSKLSRHSLK